MGPARRTLLRATAPGLLVVVLAVALEGTQAGASVVAFLRSYPALLFGGGLLLATVFRQSRAAMAIVAVGIASHALLALSSGGSSDHRMPIYVNDLTGLLLPLNLAAAALLRERGVFSGAGLARLGLVAGQAGLAALAWFAWWEGPIALVQMPILAGFLPSDTVPAHPAIVALCLALVVIVAQLVRLEGPVEGGLLAALVLSFGAVGAGSATDRSVLLMAGAGFALVVAVVHGAVVKATRDGLTGLPARGAFNERLEELGGAYVLALLDIDHFKRVNDRYGHAVGDQILRMVAARLQTVGGGGDAYRYGGEEFALVFAGKTLAASEPRLEALRRAVAESEFTLRAADRPRRKPRGYAASRASCDSLSVTVSIGAAERSDRQEDANAVLQAADKALYRAKRAGRNRVVT